MRGDGGSSRQVGGVCAAQFPKPLPSFWPKSPFLQCINIGTQSVQELFFFVIGAFVELFTVMILFKFFGCDVQQERNCT